MLYISNILEYNTIQLQNKVMTVLWDRQYVKLRSGNAKVCKKKIEKVHLECRKQVGLLINYVVVFERWNFKTAYCRRVDVSKGRNREAILWNMKKADNITIQRSEAFSNCQSVELSKGRTIEVSKGRIGAIVMQKIEIWK